MEKMILQQSYINCDDIIFDDVYLSILIPAECLVNIERFVGSNLQTDSIIDYILRVDVD